MDDEFDQTQAIFLEEFDQETDEETDHSDKKPVAHLKAFGQSGFSETTFQLFEGENVIGRHQESCSICIPLKALSREHACIEIKGDSHLIYDKNSRNKTKRNKLFLSPNVRYELKHGDTLMFGDVACKYTIGNKNDDDETGSESEYQTANDVITDKKDDTVELDEEEYDSDNSVDLLQPTQAFTNHSVRHNSGKSLLADDSLDEKGINKTAVLVGDTPAPSRQKITSGTLVEESGSETEDEAEVSKDMPQTLFVEESHEDESGDAEMLYAPTQACIGESDGDSTYLEDEDKKTIFTEATQAFLDTAHKEETSEEPATQTFVAESDDEDEEAANKKAFQYAATQACNDIDLEDEPTQTTEDEGEAVETEEEDMSHLFVESTLACDFEDFPEENERQIVTSDGGVLDEPTQAVLGYDDDDDPTQAAPADDQTKAVEDEPEEETQVVNEPSNVKPSRKQKPVTFEDATVAIQEDATVAVTGEDATVAVGEADATVAVTGEDATVAVGEADATVVVTVEDATVAVGEADATVAVTGEDATVAVGEADATVAVQEDATVAVQEDATVAVQEVATVAVQEASTLAVQDATVAVQEDATVAVQEDATLAVQEDTTVAVQEASTVAVQDATLAIQEDATKIVENSINKGKSRGRQKKSEISSAKSSVKTQDAVSEVPHQSKVGAKGKGKKRAQPETEDIEVTSSQESDDGNKRKSSRARKKSLRMVEMEESLDVLKGIDKSIKHGEDYSPKNSDTESPEKSKKTETRGRRPKVTATHKDEPKEPEVPVLTSNVPPVPKEVTKQSAVPPVPKEVIKQAEAEFLMTLPALKQKEAPAPVLTEATQPYAMETDEEPPNPEIVESTQPYVMMEEDSTPPLEEEGSRDKEEGDITPPIEDVLAATQAYAMEEEVVADSEEFDDKPALISIPSRSPLKPTLVSPEKRKKSPSPKRVQFTVKKIDFSSTSASEGEVKTNEPEPSTSRVSRSSVTKGTKGKQSTMADSEKKNEEKESTTKSKRGKRSVATKSEIAAEDKSEIKSSEKVEQMSGKTSRGRRSMIHKAEDEKTETSEVTTKTRGRRSIVTKKENDTAVKKEEKSDEKDEEINETVALISDGEKDTEIDNVVEKSGCKGRSRVTTTTLISDGEKDTEIDNVVEKSGHKGRSRVTTTTLISDGEKDTEIDNVVEKSGRKGRSRVTTTSEAIVSTSDNKEATGEVKESKPVNVGKKKESKSVSTKSKESRTERQQTDSNATVDVSDKKVGRKGRSSVQHKDGETEESEPKATTSKKAGRKSVVENIDNTKKENIDNHKKNVSKTTGNEEISDNENERKTNDTNKMTNQRGRKGRTSVITKIEDVASADIEFKSSGRRGRSSNVVENESKDSSKIENSKSSESTLSGRKGRSVAGSSASIETTKNIVKEEETKTVKRGGQRSSSQPPNKTEESKPVESGRRGRSFIQTKIDNKEEETMPPPRSTGRRGKKDTEDIATSSTQGVQKNSKNDEINNDSKKVGKDIKNKKSFNLDVTLEENTSSDSTDHSKKRSPRKSGQSEIVESSESKPVRGKRKRDSSGDSSENVQSKQLKTEKNVENNVTVKRERISRGRNSDVLNKSESQKSDIEPETDTTKNKAKTKAEPKASMKRGRADKQDSVDSPAKKAKLKEEPLTPQPKKTLAVGSPSLRRKSVEPTKPRVMFTGVIDEHGQKIIRELGGELADNVQDCTHLVTDKVRRTVKFLCCLARGIPIVTLQWIESCKQTAMFVDAGKFQVKDTASEKQHKFSLHRSLEKAKEACLMQGYRIHVTKSVKPDPSQMKEIIECAGGQFLSTLPKKFEEKTVVVSCQDDQSLCSNAIKSRIPVVSSEFILTGLLRQEISIASYTLFTETTDSQGSTSHRKKR